MSTILLLPATPPPQPVLHLLGIVRPVTSPTEHQSRRRTSVPHTPWWVLGGVGPGVMGGVREEGREGKGGWQADGSEQQGSNRAAAEGKGR
ncbi:hypothetical protein E2C01_017872 [Portunus trituberculatus]|uniref:Uncharacterized protein n=1 Tax=Portunus trituberculatus TaxID=210409 RepID=A0A5B7DTM6_PORTR|nr:hypothetical protein [Portunus trituberculatus]